MLFILEQTSANTTMRPSQLAVAVLVLTFAYLVYSNPQRQRSTERPFVDQYREYFPEDETKFFFNYTYGDDSKRVFFRSGNARKAAVREDRNKDKRPTYVSDIDIDRPYGADDGYNYEKPANGLNYDRPNNNKRAQLPYKVSFNLFKDE